MVRCGERFLGTRNQVPVPGRSRCAQIPGRGSKGWTASKRTITGAYNHRSGRAFSSKGGPKVAEDLDPTAHIRRSRPAFPRGQPEASAKLGGRPGRCAWLPQRALAQLSRNRRAKCDRIRLLPGTSGEGVRDEVGIDVAIGTSLG